MNKIARAGSLDAYDKKNYAIFEKLDYAYIGGRFDIRFKITKEELEYIAPLVKKLLDITEEICLKEIKSLETLVKA